MATKQPTKTSKARAKKSGSASQKKEPSPPLGGICHVEIPAPDLAKAKKFYSAVFGWKICLEPGERYAMFNDGVVWGGMNPSAVPSGKNGINLVLKVADIPAKLAQIKRAGGTVVSQKREIFGGYGFLGDFKDPNGNLLSIWSKK